MLPRSRVAKPIRLGPIRELTAAETATLREPRSRTMSTVDKLRDSHHEVALLFSMGMSEAEVSAITGYSHTRLSTLRNNPAFAELIAQKRGSMEAEVVDARAASLVRKIQLNAAAERHLLQAIDDADAAGETLPIKTSLALVSDMSDRIGLGKHSTVTNQHEIGSRLERAIARSAKAKAVGESGTAGSIPATGMTEGLVSRVPRLIEAVASPSMAAPRRTADTPAMAPPQPFKRRA